MSVEPGSSIDDASSVWTSDTAVASHDRHSSSGDLLGHRDDSGSDDHDEESASLLSNTDTIVPKDTQAYPPTKLGKRGKDDAEEDGIDIEVLRDPDRDNMRLSPPVSTYEKSYDREHPNPRILYRRQFKLANSVYVSTSFLIIALSVWGLLGGPSTPDTSFSSNIVFLIALPPALLSLVQHSLILFGAMLFRPHEIPNVFPRLVLEKTGYWAIMLMMILWTLSFAGVLKAASEGGWVNGVVAALVGLQIFTAFYVAFTLHIEAIALGYVSPPPSKRDRS